MPSLGVYFTNLPSVLYIAHLACQIKDDWLKLDLKAKNQDFNIEKDYFSFCSLNEDANEKLLYLQDICTLNIKAINYAVINSLMYYTIMPLVVCNMREPTKDTFVKINSSLFFLNQAFDAIAYEPFQNILIILLLLHRIPKSILAYSNEIPQKPYTYSEKWAYKKNSQAMKLSESII